jgi:hypothetical protein
VFHTPTYLRSLSFFFITHTHLHRPARTHTHTHTHTLVPSLFLTLSLTHLRTQTYIYIYNTHSLSLLVGAHPLLLQVIYSHPVYNFSVVKYDPSLLIDSDVAAATLSDKPLKSGDSCCCIGLSKPNFYSPTHQLVACTTRVTKVQEHFVNYLWYALWEGHGKEYACSLLCVCVCVYA